MYSTNKLHEIEKILQGEGFSSDDNFDSQFRYSILKEPEISLILGVKLSIKVPLLNDPPIELVSFYPSICVRPRRLDESFETMVHYLCAALKELIIKLEPYNYDFDIEKYKSQISELVKKLYPNKDTFDAESLKSENMVISTIRDNILRDYDTFETSNMKISQDVFDIYRDFHLMPTNELPPELFGGLPHKRRNWVIIFKRDYPEEYILEEPGCFTYWRDYTHKNTWIRIGLESYTVNIWYQAFKDQNFRLNYLFYDWVVYCRGLTKKIIDLILNQPQFDFGSLKSFSEIRLLKDFLSKRETPGLFLPRIINECLKSPEKQTADQFLFEGAPCSLEEMSAIEDFTQAELYERKGNYIKTQELLLRARKKLKKFHHINGQIKILFKLNDIVLRERDFINSIDYMKEALELAKSGQVSITDIINIHLSLISSYALGSSSFKSEEHYQIIKKFLKNAPSSSEIEKLIMQTHLELAKLRMIQHEFPEANEHFKELLKSIKKSPNYEFLYYFERSHYYKALKKSPMKQFLSLKKAVEINKGPLQDRIMAHFELAKFYLYTKMDSENAIKFLTIALDLITDVDIQSLKMKVKVYEILADSYHSRNYEEAANQSIQEAERIQERIDRLN